MSYEKEFQGRIQGQPSHDSLLSKNENKIITRRGLPLHDP